MGDSATIYARDPLTGLASSAEAREWLQRAPAPDYLQAMLVGLHRFRSVNIAYGNAGGDLALAEIARRIRDFAVEELGPSAIVARISGGEFLVACTGAMPRERWQWLAEALGRTVGRALPVHGDVLHLLPRIALLRRAPGESAGRMLDRLDQALGSLEQLPGRRVMWADGSHRARGRSAARLEADLIGAMARDEIGLVFQPQYCVNSGALAGAEVLARWNHPQLGRIGAETLFAIAERGDHIEQLSSHIIQRALASDERWKGHLPLSINITAEDLAAEDFAAGFAQALDHSGFPPAQLTLEVTEQSLIADFVRSASSLKTIAALGVRIALDDFGTGYANFRTLKALPIDTLKLDASLVGDVDTDPRDRAILKAIVAMAKALGQKIVVEGIEREGQLAVLAQEGCDVFQGFLRSGPVSGEAIAAML
ncbi:MAG: GGDEF domain-containing protein [Novosphingobium sp. 28-62-57]|uniref:bifunctional diguanylate cyclase/phosphodiesterase n=1 Tax=unclassified Novosphingobium TaxID=2644732 RepID=UPI000BD954FD|nr:MULTISPECIES: bifunctional diguanylate cyclase/phosphodiesterase [unclassified Novosphingobium]OYW49602.1 MAG: GGDEF domain-containing protein [Novosphingobium sp. 12-62-10]OYZ12442.1 MAG: GGDEF domain-containing protein [Novosphingobium sp. 28-62-57]OZA39973.1 MAG: GGDEF domain-containing protein [Novosphingobium sp. 17-62-9]HQS68420.1 bifunctional diguanylate cyclase/phosphodiesterase [Novosphingobium sp.]